MEKKFSLPQDGGLVLSGIPKDIVHRYEKIPTSIYETEREGVKYVADVVVKAINDHEASGVARPFALGLTTGRTPLGIYLELVERYKQGLVSFKNVEVFSLDEFYPIGAREIQSRNFRIHEDLLNHIVCILRIKDISFFNIL